MNLMKKSISDIKSKKHIFIIDIFNKDPLSESNPSPKWLSQYEWMAETHGPWRSCVVEPNDIREVMKYAEACFLVGSEDQKEHDVKEFERTFKFKAKCVSIHDLDVRVQEGIDRFNSEFYVLINNVWYSYF